MTRPVLFLDFDGVLNSGAWFRAGDRGPDDLDPAAVAILNDIVDCTDCSVVVSSTWRLLHPLTELRRILGNHGYRFGLRDQTPELSSVEQDRRGAEIAAWLHAHPTPRFAILDDDNDMGPLAHKLVQTSFATGLVGLSGADRQRLAALLGRRGR